MEKSGGGESWGEAPAGNREIQKVVTKENRQIILLILSLSLSLRTAVTSPLLGQIGLLGELVVEMAFLADF